ncbi:MAG TPA: porin [Bacteroidota bacterium]|nr:porin [Bacteroidota bacterium]
MKQRLIFCMIGFMFLTTPLRAQDTTRAVSREEFEETESTLEGIGETLADIRNTVDALKKLKISGYLQSQYQVAQTRGVSSVAGGNFPTNVRSRFSVRRGRIKFNYVNDLSQYVLQIDVTQNGVGIKDAYVAIIDPWEKTFGLTAGVFDRPFGFEISYSSGSREMPERSRLFQALFPGERELGAKLEILPQEGPISFFNFRGGFFNGVSNTANENNRHKDFIGRMGVQLPITEENLAIDGGVSFYSGKVTNTSKFVYSVEPSQAVKRFAVDSAVSNTGAMHARDYYGGDIQLYYDVPGFGGLSLRGEYITGTQPGTSSGTSFYNPYTSAGATDAVTALYMRKFAGWYVAYIQNIGVAHQFVARYDEFDPNTDVSGADVGVSGGNLGPADLRISTFGLGWIYHFDASVKFTFYYDIVMNEKAAQSATGSLAAFREDLEDNVFTLRAQFRF